jgi:DNA-binding response OmpR family regulator
LIEADEAYRAVIGACVRLTGCRTQSVRTPSVAYTALARRRFDLVVWGAAEADSERHGAIISELRLRTEAPLVLIASEFGTVQWDFEAGADQYLPKPFVPGALVGSIQAALRRSMSPIVPAAVRMEVRGMVLDSEGRQLSMRGRHVELTRQEWDLLLILVSHPNRFLRAREIIRLGWRTGQYGPEQVRIYVRRLRRKLEPMALPCSIVSRHGQGYSLAFEGDPQAPTSAAAEGA